ncbi:hypothetical protein [Sphingomonas sp.]|uniref:hypothetical protein n=1 Tax=Sphingomonas sp. TaxID=28214 RepID=UPI003F71C29F
MTATTQTIDANLNSVQCIVTKNHFGYDVVHNICTGTTTRLEWALGDWAGAAGLSLVALLGLAVVGLLIVLVASMWREGF